MPALLTTSCVLGCICALIWWLVYRSRTRTLLAGLPTLSNGCFIKDLYQLCGDSQYLLRLVKHITNRIEVEKSPLVIWVGPITPLICFSDPDDVKSVLNVFLEKTFVYNYAKDLMGNGLITASPSTWKLNHKKLTGFYTSGSLLERHQGLFNKQAQALVDMLREEAGTAGSAPFDIQHKYLDYTTLAAIYQITINQRLDKVTPCVCKAYNRSLALFTDRGLKPLYYSDFIYKLSPSYRELMKHVKLLNNLCEMEIEERKKERDEIKGFTTLSNTREKLERTFLDLLLDLSETDSTFTKQQIVSELNTMIAAGQETISITMTLILIMIGSKPDIQHKLYAEMKEIFGDSKRPIEKEDLSRMRYCEAIVNETLRMYPAVPVVLRNADQELALKSFTVPKGTICGIFIWGVQMSKSIWGPDAEEFRPERWLTDRIPSSATFIPFSYGKRMCIGVKYSMTLLKTLLAYCVRELEFQSEADQLELKLDVSLKTVSGHLVQVRLRE